jgi:hypothetical protein
MEENQRRCEPPLNDDEVESIATSVSRYAPASDAESRRLTDLGNAERLLNLHGENIRFCPQVGWLIWNEKRWRKDELGEILARAKETVRLIYTKAQNTKVDERRQAIARHAAKSESRERINAMVTLAQSERDERWAEFQKVAEVAKDQVRGLADTLMGLAKSLTERCSHAASTHRLGERERAPDNRFSPGSFPPISFCRTTSSAAVRIRQAGGSLSGFAILHAFREFDRQRRESRCGAKQQRSRASGLRREFSMSANYILNGRVDPSGNLTDKAAKEYAAKNHTDYATALKVIVRNGQRRYAEENYGWPMPSEVNAPAGIVQAYRAVADIAASAKNDVNEAVRRINQIFDGATISAAAQFVVLRRANQIVANLSPGATDANLAGAYRQVAAEMPEVWNLYSNGGEMTPEAARSMFNQRYFSSRTNEVHRYSAEGSHIRHDASGNEFRVYTLDCE